VADASRQVRKIRLAREQHAGAAPSKRRGFFVPLPATAFASALLAIILIGATVFAWSAWPRSPSDDSAEAGFLRDMVTHHSQAVEMSLIIRDRTSDENLRYLATDIAMTQATQMGAMQGYLDLWGLPLTGEDKPMAWMDHPVDGLMPGMATPDEIAQLSSLPVDQAEVLFLRLMIRHHQGGVEMAEAVLDRSDQEQVVRLADRIVTGQQTEIDTMNDMLVARGQQPITDPLPMDGHDDGDDHEH
jgi:uncharacterized protein (DUF305 family)